MTTFEANVEHIKSLFPSTLSPQDLYQKIISLGRKMPPMPLSYQTDDALVPGCQSSLYLHTSIREGKTHFLAASDALISAGLAALLLLAYNNVTPEEVAENKPLFLQELGVIAALSPSRTNGVANLYLKMKNDTLKYLL